MENEALSVEDFASQLTQADTADHPEEESAQLEDGQGGEEGGHDDPQAGAEDAPTEEEGDDPEKPESPSEEAVIKWTTANGDSFEVTVDELKKGYMRERDYTQQTQNLSEQRRTEEVMLREQYQLMGAMAEEIGALQGLGARLAQFQNVDWNRLYAEDPETAQRLSVQQMQLKDQMRDAQAAFQQKNQTLIQNGQQRIAQAKREAFEHLRSNVKGFDEKSLKDLETACMKAGYSLTTLRGIEDKNIALDLWKARQWDALQSKKPEVQNRVKKLPPVTAGKPQRQSAPPTKQEAVMKALSSKKSLSVNEFAGLLSQTR